MLMISKIDKLQCMKQGDVNLLCSQHADPQIQSMIYPTRHKRHQNDNFLDPWWELLIDGPCQL